MPPKLRGRGAFIDPVAVDRFRRAYGALTDDDGATDVALPSDKAEVFCPNCPAGSGFNFEPGDGSITCANCGKNLNVKR